jgi:hypothetical protein
MTEMIAERSVVSNIREKGQEVSLNGGKLTLDGIFVDIALFKRVCNKILSPDGSRDVGYRLELINNEIIVTECPSLSHEIIAQIFNMELMKNFYLAPYMPVGSTRWNFGASSVEPDASYSNLRVPQAQRRLDVDGKQLPDIVLEVGRTQTYQSLFARPAVYFSYPGVKVVILIKLVGRDQMIAVVYRIQADGTHGPTAAVSFGRRLHVCMYICIECKCALCEQVYK